MKMEKLEYRAVIRFFVKDGLVATEIHSRIVKGTTMGKKKNSKTKNVFKVAGSKGLKAKKKAKAVQGNLKKIVEMNRKKITQVDEQLSNVHDQLRRGVKAQTKVVNPVKQIKKPIPQNIEASTSKTVDKLDQLKM